MCRNPRRTRRSPAQLSQEIGDPLKGKLQRIVAMLTRLAMRSDRVSESPAWYDPGIDYEHEHEHRFAEHE